MSQFIEVTTKDISGGSVKHQVNLDLVKRISNYTGNGFSCIIIFSENEKLSVLQTYEEVKNLMNKE